MSSPPWCESSGHFLCRFKSQFSAFKNTSVLQNTVKSVVELLKPRSILLSSCLINETDSEWRSRSSWLLEKLNTSCSLENWVLCKVHPPLPPPSFSQEQLKFVSLFRSDAGDDLGAGSFPWFQLHRTWKYSSVYFLPHQPCCYFAF